jgi:protoheme IX farnesyltransferase
MLRFFVVKDLEVLFFGVVKRRFNMKDSYATTMKSVNTVMEPGPLTGASPTKTWRDYLMLSKMGIVVSNLLTTFAGIWLAARYTGVNIASEIPSVILTLLGAALIMAGSTYLNNYIDRDIDPIMKRTQKRPTVTGTIPHRQVLLIGLSLAASGIVLLFLVNLLAVLFGLIGLFVYVVIYTMWLKRTHSINTIVGSISGAMPPLIGWAAIDPSMHAMAWILFAFMFVWQPPHFLALAMKRCEEYRAAGIPMLPVVSGFEVTKRQMILYVASLIPLSLFLWSFGAIYLISAGLLGLGWLVLGLAHSLIKDDILWARMMFVYSTNYMTIMFLLMIIVNI